MSHLTVPGRSPSLMVTLVPRGSTSAQVKVSPALSVAVYVRSTVGSASLLTVMFRVYSREASAVPSTFLVTENFWCASASPRAP